MATNGLKDLNDAPYVVCDLGYATLAVIRKANLNGAKVFKMPN